MCEDISLNTNKYLGKLDLEQLKYAKMICSQLIEEKEREAKVTVWRVVEHSYCHGNFLDYLEAAEALAAIAKELHSEGADDYDKSLELTREYIPESEVGDFIDNYKSKKDTA